jgi:hypothetical protein
MTSYVTSHVPRTRTTDAATLARYLGSAAFPRTGEELTVFVGRGRAPASVVRAVLRLTPEKLYHDLDEVWFDATHPWPGGGPRVVPGSG